MRATLHPPNQQFLSVIQVFWDDSKSFDRVMSVSCQSLLHLCLSFLRMRPSRKEVLQTTASRKTTKRLVTRARRRSQNQRKTKIFSLTTLMGSRQSASWV